MKFVFGRLGEANMRRAHATPASSHQEGKRSGRSVRKSACCSGVEHKVGVALLLMSERGEDVAANAEVSRAHVRAFFGSGEGQGEAAEVI